MLVLQHPDWVLATIDISDAFLTVDQLDATLVSYVDKDGNETMFSLGKVLPGQRCGSRDWYESITDYLKEEIAVEVCPSYPVLLRSASRDCLMHLHVDDIMSGCERERLMRDIIPKLKKRYKISVSILEVGGSVHFLKKKFVLMSPTEMLICPHVKHFDKLFQLLHIKETDHPKKIPYDSKLDEPDYSAPLDSAESTIYRLVGQYEDVVPVETLSDSDWASNKASRKSVTASMVYMGGSLMFSASRTQKVISLSSAEAEVHAATSTMIDGLMVKTLLDFATGSSVTVNHFMDSAAGLGVLKRSGIGKIRHLSCRILWTQEAVKCGRISLNKVDTKINVSDLGTKCLSRARINLLLNFCGIFDCELDCLVGEEERRQFEEQKFVKQGKAVLGKLSKAQMPLGFSQ
ncbi:Retrovirus-related Pol polyprotein from transposon TNT 1-94 [Symbiodinium microadriaticum]|uniref:Retrovirus-related Pol polyprotein from transposon TNT 1-94 n=1 Tax=Symbiodinium microadriaticum TaxID=2951 RepID=A0A1Q9BZ48_SYMMI|nr:Retrovirus-related Pol polyprotein from transposon TNT 1-94 [Symbiodinium microadriaticum]